VARVSRRAPPRIPPRGLTSADLRPGGAFRLEGTTVVPIGGARAQANGQGAELLVEANHQLCLERKVARIRKLPTPFKMLGQLTEGDVGVSPRRRELAGKHFGFPETEAGADYFGHTWTELGTQAQPIVAECKSTEDGYVHLARVAPLQREDLDGVLGRGIAALLVVHEGALYAVPWGAVRARAAVHARDLARCRVAPDECWPARWLGPGGAPR
jgi:hypothetical protein